MKNIKKGIDLNIDVVNYAPITTLKQEDNATLELNLYKDGEEFNITGQTVTLAAKRSDKVIIEQIDGFTINNNTLTINLKNNIIAKIGLVYLELTFKDVEGSMTTLDFNLKVNGKLLGEDSLDASDNIASLEKVKQDFINSSNALLEDATENENTRVQAEKIRKNDEETRNRSETSRTNAETKRVEAEKTRVNQESLRVAAEEERVAAERIRDEKVEEISSQCTKNTKEIENISDNISDQQKIKRNLFEIGTIKDTNGEEVGLTTRIRSIGFYEKGEKKILVKNLNPILYKYTLRIYNDSGNFIYYPAQWYNENFYLEDIIGNYNFSKFKILIAKADDSEILNEEIAPIADSIELNTVSYIDLKETISKVENNIDFLTTITNKIELNVVIGAISNSDGIESGLNTRAYCSNYVDVKKNIYISVPEDLRFSLRYYDESATFISGDKDWRSGNFNLSKGDNAFSKLRIVFKTVNDDVIDADKVNYIKNNCIVEYKSLLKDICNKKDIKYDFSISSVVNPYCDISRKTPQYLTLCAVKENIMEGQQTKTVGWLYRDNVEPYNFYYASGNADNIIPIFKWKKEITHDGLSLPINYSFSITNEGDIICVYRGENVLSNIGNRQNPIVYQHENYENPILIDFGSDEPPTSWLQNSGCCSIDGIFYFCEYTRVYHKKAYIWKVEAPYTSRSNWKIVKEFSVSGDWNVGFKHCHMVDVDPYSNLLYASTGDDDNASKIIYSRDDGTTWSELATGEKYCRQLNFIWCEDYVYWATDSGKTDKHFFFRAKRKVTGEIDMSTVEDLYKFPNSSAQPATYHVCLIENPNGILILDRCDSKNTEIMKVYFWDIENNTMRVIGTIEPAGEGFTGFRCEAVNHYQSYTDDRIICGFSYFPNQIKIFDNVITSNVNSITGAVEDDSTNEFKVNNIAISVRKLIG